MSNRYAPVGVFDSGVGGLTVAREVIRRMPGESIVYVGDVARLPYGNKSREVIVRYSRQIAAFLLEKGVKAIVIACNTASAYALPALEEMLPVPVMGVIGPGAAGAAAATKNRRVGIIGTRGTVDSGMYEAAIKALRPEVEVYQKACPLLVPLVEEGLLHDQVTDEIASRYLSSLKSRYIDTLVLGCTHYPLIEGAIGRIMGEGVQLVNPAGETANSLSRLLSEKGLAHPGGREKGEGRYEFYTSDRAGSFADFASLILPEIDIRAREINLEERQKG